MTDETCGADTTGDQPCQNPAGENGRCWIPSHQPDADDDVENPSGRPSKLDDVRDDLLEAAARGTTKEGCARAAGIAPSTLYDWLDQYPEFSEAFSRARAQAEQQLVEAAAVEDPKWVLERSYGYVKTEKREVDLDADVAQTTTHELGEDEKEMALETLRQLQEDASE